MFVGPTCIGKTELARAMADGLFGGVDHLMHLDMSEYAHDWAVSRILGPIPAFVGSTEPDNWLTTKVTQMPECVVLLNEIEKAHPTVWGHVPPSVRRRTSHRFPWHVGRADRHKLVPRVRTKPNHHPRSTRCSQLESPEVTQVRFQERAGGSCDWVRGSIGQAFTGCAHRDRNHRVVRGAERQSRVEGEARQVAAHRRLDERDFGNPGSTSGVTPAIKPFL